MLKSNRFPNVAATQVNEPFTMADAIITIIGSAMFAAVFAALGAYCAGAFDGWTGWAG